MRPGEDVAGSMLFVRRFVAAQAVLLVVYAVYAATVAPWLEPPPALQRRASPTYDRPLPSAQVAEELIQLFPPDAWERQHPKLVETEQATLLIRDYQPLADGRLELKPCTLIFHLGGRTPASPSASAAADQSPSSAAPAAASRRRLLVLQSSRAELVFDRPLDLRRGQFGRVEKGTLLGPITIYSPPTQPDGSDSLRITTDTVWLTRESITTAGQVEFQFGPNSGRGRDMEITLLPPPPGSARRGRPAAGGIQSVALKQVEKLRVVAGQGAWWSAEGSAAAGAANPTYLEITCRGPLTLDVPSQQARFEEQVELVRQVPGGRPDRMRCDELWLHFALRGTEDSAPPASASTSSQPPLPTAAEGTNPSSTAQADSPPRPPPIRADDPLAGRLRRIVARGRPVVLDAPDSQLRVEAEHLEYAVPEQTFILRPASEETQASPRPVQMVRQQQSFVARQIHYQAEGPGRLGRLWAAGPGEMRAVQGVLPSQQTITIRWEKELRIQPQDRNQVISLVEAASVTVEPLGRFDAKEIHLWVVESTVPLKPLDAAPATADAVAAPSAASPPATPRPSEKRPSEKTVILPDRLLAVGDVRLASPQMDAQTSRLEVWFLNLPPKMPPPPRSPDQPLSEPVQPAAFTPAALVTPSPASAEPPPPAAMPPAAEAAASPVPAAQAASLQKFHVSGGLIQMQLALRGQTGDLEDLTIRGHATIDEVRTEQPGQVPIRVRGHVLQLRHGTQPDATIDITGQPAELGGRGLWLAGGHIHIHRGRNELVIDGPGEATWPAPFASGEGLVPLADASAADGGPAAAGSPSLPPGALEPAQGIAPQAAAGTLAAPPAAPAAAGEVSPSLMHVVWQRGLRFDGRTARFEGDVQIRTTRQTVLAAVLEATLKEPLSFQPTGRPPQAVLAQVWLDGGPAGLLLEHRAFDPQGRLAAHERLFVRNLHIDRTTNQLTAQGPGWFSSVRPAAGMARSAGWDPSTQSPPLPQPAATLQPPSDAVPAPPASPGSSASGADTAGPGIAAPVDPAPASVASGQAGSGLASIYITFERGIVGNLEERWIELQQHVQTTYRPARDWSDVQAVTRPQTLDPRGLVMTSDQLRLTQMAVGPRRWFELLATGNVLVEGRELTVQAPRVAYGSDKEVLTIEGQGRVMARAWVGRNRNFLEGQRLQYHLRTGAATTDRIQNIRIQLGTETPLSLPGMSQRP